MLHAQGGVDHGLGDVAVHDEALLQLHDVPQHGVLQEEEVVGDRGQDGVGLDGKVCQGGGHG